MNANMMQCTVRLPSDKPPNGLSSERVPQFVAFTFDDNGKSGLPGAGTKGGMSFVLDLFDSARNPDGTPTRGTFLAAGFYTGPGQWENGSFVKKSWKLAADKGHEIGNHTYTHPNGRRENFTAERWSAEIERCAECLTNPFNPAETAETKSDANGIGLSRNSIIGFRAPYLGYNDALFDALSRLGFAYDCTVSEGFQAGQDGSNCLWPYTLDQGSPGDFYTASGSGREPIGSHPGLWELPTYVVTVPPDERCQEYGITKGLRAKLASRFEGFNPADGKIDGLDWTLWSAFELNADEFVATFKYSLDIKYTENRAPMIFCFHSDIYADDYDDPMPNAGADERRRALKECYEYAAGLADARISTMTELLEWLKNPAPLP